jgi:two-component system, NtrC family, response regulator AlgB
MNALAQPKNDPAATAANNDKPAGRILIIDDDAAILTTFQMFLEGNGFHVTTANTARDGERAAARQPHDVCLLDLSIGDDSGMESLPRLRQLAPGLRIIMVTAHGAVENAMEALRTGAHDYLVKPCSPEQLRIAVARQMEARRLTQRVEALEREVPREEPELESAHSGMKQILSVARQVAQTDANVLILGESGTGKGVVARAIHLWSKRHENGFVTINCPSLSAELLESELFGHNKGSFTGAIASTSGRVSQADGGTLFLDEVGDFPLSLQPKLLRFIQDKEYERIGDPVTRRADVRIVAATNHDLEQMARDGTFRQDLLYRLNVIVVTLPPLRERVDDIAPLAQYFMARFASRYGRPVRQIGGDAETALRAYRWPGNIRELQNVMERAVILCADDVLGASHLTIGTGGSANSDGTALVGSNISLDELERQHIRAVLARAHTLDEAAKTLGIDASTLYRKRKAFSLD